MQNVDITIEDSRWADLAFETICQRALTAGLDHTGLNRDAAEISVLACDDARIADLNGAFRGKAAPTNVLSWPSQDRAAAQPGGMPDPPTPGPDGVIALGDIAISYDTCHAEARSAGKSVADHITHLMVHGLLHLLGYDHIDDQDAALMEGEEAKILGKLGLDDPY